MEARRYGCRPSLQLLLAVLAAFLRFLPGRPGRALFSRCLGLHCGHPGCPGSVLGLVLT